MAEWKEYTVADVISTVIDYRGKTPKKLGGDWSDSGYRALSAKNIKTGKIVQSDSIRYVSEDMYRCWMKEEVQKEDILITSEAPFGQIYYWNSDEKIVLSQRLFAVRVNQLFYPKYIYFYMTSSFFQAELDGRATGTTVVGLRQPELLKCKIFAPDYQEQKRIADTLWCLEQKINNNEAINNNLEEQLSALFVNMFGHSIDFLDNSDIKLGDLIESVDNRGKTPPLSDEPTDYPIIDVRALSGNSRIIDYTNCTKYVSKETYNNWFRSGHPKEYDILISTVGSLAEMKIFLGTIGCIAQNVVGFRTKGISPLYLYQYLNYIKNDLVAYNIGSVQPSIKVTHIIKHSIYVASKEDIEIFDSIARNITKKIFANCQENEALKQMRDTLLPKLMSGELDVSNIKI